VEKRRFIAIAMMIIILLVGLSAWPAAHVVSGETSSLRLRARTKGVAGGMTNVVSGSISLVLPYIYNPDQGNLGGKTGFVFAILCAASAFVAWRAVPEMKDRTPAEIDELFERRVKAGDFKSSSCGEYFIT
jgi:membrane protein implicated in regulation of membrane protease activity